MTIIPPEYGPHKIAYNLTGPEIVLIEDLRRCPDKHAEPVTHAERNLLALLRIGKAEMAAYMARAMADEALGYRDAS